jgi:ABC-2 type transport system ATP-binding protein
MKQRLHLARGLIASPEVLLLDEPTIGLDPVAAREMRQIIRQLKENGTTIFLTTHNMAEAESLCDRVAFINEGLIPLVERPRVLTRLASELRQIDAEFVSTTGNDLAEQLRGLSGVHDVVLSAGTDGVVGLAIKTDEGGYGPALAMLAAAQPIRVTTREATLEDVYLRLLGERGMRV